MNKEKEARMYLKKECCNALNNTTKKNVDKTQEDRIKRQVKQSQLDEEIALGAMADQFSYIQIKIPPMKKTVTELNSKLTLKQFLKTQIFNRKTNT